MGGQTQYFGVVDIVDHGRHVIAIGLNKHAL